MLLVGRMLPGTYEASRQGSSWHTPCLFSGLALCCLPPIGDLLVALQFVSASAAEVAVCWELSVALKCYIQPFWGFCGPAAATLPSSESAAFFLWLCSSPWETV
jgi:hypothetical protein